MRQVCVRHAVPVRPATSYKAFVWHAIEHTRSAACWEGLLPPRLLLLLLHLNHPMLYLATTYAPSWPAVAMPAAYPGLSDAQWVLAGAPALPVGHTPLHHHHHLHHPGVAGPRAPPASPPVDAHPAPVTRSRTAQQQPWIDEQAATGSKLPHLSCRLKEVIFLLIEDVCHGFGINVSISTTEAKQDAPQYSTQRGLHNDSAFWPAPVYCDAALSMKRIHRYRQAGINARQEPVRVRELSEEVTGSPQRRGGLKTVVVHFLDVEKAPTCQQAAALCLLSLYPVHGSLQICARLHGAKAGRVHAVRDQPRFKPAIAVADDGKTHGNVILAPTVTTHCAYTCTHL